MSIAGTAMGTLGYMAPEVLTGGIVDERADIFAIGVMVVETLVGARPFGGQHPQEVLTALLQGEYHLPGGSAEIRALDAVVQRCLAKDPRDRYGSAAELAKDFSSYASKHVQSVMPCNPREYLWMLLRCNNFQGAIR